jgi:NADPH:quinone reductase-like Zn-dependent oxidoreductase
MVRPAPWAPTQCNSPRHCGAKVTAVTSTPNAALVTRLGADDVIDYTKDGVLSTAMRFDVVLDCVGNLTIGPGRRLLTDGGVLVLAVASLWTTIRARGNVVAGSAPERVEDFELLVGLVAGGELTVVHDGIYDLDDIVEAHRRVDTGHKRGNIIVRPCRSEEGLR